tara:strand:+ start:302 stop:2650 length:2349 start_codon:yes stop_codon:yes gene_type:complete
MALYNADLKPLAGATHPYDHATRLFLSDNFRLAPKQTFLYYVCINVDQSALQSILGGLASDSVGSQTLIEQYETGLMAKRVELPRFNVQTRSLKAYNRKNIFQTGIMYDPLSITFHDDAADTVTKFWNDFYTYYYRDSDYDSALYTVPHKYQARAREGWGYTPRNGNLKPFIRDIQIFSLHNKRFTEYKLINPVITAWRGGEHDSSQGNSTMDATMTVDFETVKYRTGYVNPVDVNGFAVIHYDDTPSPISNSTTNIYTDGGLVGAIEGTSTDLARPDGTGSGSGILSSILDAYRFYNNIKDTNFKQVGSIVLGQVGAQILNGAVNGAVNNVFFPTAGSTSQVFQQPGTVASMPYSSPNSSSSVTIGGVAAGLVAGATAGIVNTAVNAFSQGVKTSNGPLPNPGFSTVYQTPSGTPFISVDSQTGQPVTSQQTGYFVDATTGELTSEFRTEGSQNGGFLGEESLTTNLRNVVNSTDQNGEVVATYVYNNGDRVSYNGHGAQLSFKPGNFTNSSNTNTNPTTSQQLAAQGQQVNTNQVQYAVDPATGLIYTAGGTTSAYVTNTLSGVGGAVAGGYIGSKVYGGLSGVLGNGVIGQTVSAAVSGIAGAVVGQATNNLLQPIVNTAVGGVTQVFDNVTGSIKNVVGSWTGSGGYDFNNPLNNSVSRVFNGNGTETRTFKDGSTGLFDLSGTLQSSTASTGGGLFSNFGSWFGGSAGSNADSDALFPGFGNGVLTDATGAMTDFFGSFGTGFDLSNTFNDVSSLYGPSTDLFSYSTGGSYDDSFYG